MLSRSNEFSSVSETPYIRHVKIGILVAGDPLTIAVDVVRHRSRAGTLDCACPVHVACALRVHDQEK